MMVTGAKGMEKKREDGKIKLTLEGYRKLEEELRYLKTVRRKEVADKINHALSFGDLSENAEYEEAKNEQAFVEGRILAIEEKLRKAEIVAEEEDLERVRLGVRVVLENLSQGKQVEYTIVDSVGADPAARKISFESPIAQALMGKRKGEEVEIKVPAGVVRYRIVDILSREE
jgi:transcription elongation factor GreA